MLCSKIFGPAGDFCWGARAGLFAGIVHVPEFLATWRIHSQQASAGYRTTADERGRMVAMLDEALRAAPRSPAARHLNPTKLRRPYAYASERLRYAEAGGAAARLTFLAGLALRSPRFAFRLITRHRRIAPDPAEDTRSLIRECGLEKHLVPLPGANTQPPP